MDRRKFLNTLSASAAASIAGAATLSAKADALEDAMEAGIEKRRAKPEHCFIEEGWPYDENDKRPYYQHYDPALPPMPKAPTLLDFYKLRFSTNHVTQSARLAQKNGSSEKVVLACLMHDIGLSIMGTNTRSVTSSISARTTCRSRISRKSTIAPRTTSGTCPRVR
jgi:hypothetical protein